MALKRKLKVSEAFSMASMTDIIFLLLIFFMVVSTLVVPNAIKVNLPFSVYSSERYAYGESYDYRRRDLLFCPRG